MKGNVREQMTDGIDNTKCIVVFITKEYYAKVNGREDCRLETFEQHAARVFDLLATCLAEIHHLSDDETLTYLHSTISTKRHAVVAPELPVFLDARVGGKHGKCAFYVYDALGGKRVVSRTFAAF